MKVLTFLILLVSAPVLASSPDAPLVCRAPRVASAAEFLANFDVGFDLDLVDYDLFDGGAVSAGYEYRVEPAYTDGLYARTDAWGLKTNLVPGTSGEFTDRLSWGFRAGARHQLEARFIRFFDSACEAEVAAPYSPRRMPLKARVALSDRFAKGDYFVLKASLGFVVSADLLQLLGNPLWSVSASASYLVQGAYQVHVVRLSDTRVRLKVIARRGKERSAGVGIGWSGEFDVFGVSVLDNQLRRLVDPEPLKLRYTRANTDVILIDYDLDLTDAAVAQAFDQALKASSRLTALQLATPFKSPEALEENIILDLAPLEELYQSDRSHGELGRITRSLSSRASQDANRLGVEVGNRVLGFDFDATSATSRMALREDTGEEKRYLLRSFEREFDGQFAYSWARLFTRNTTEVLLSAADTNFSSLTLDSLVRTLERKDNRFSLGEYRRLREQLRRLLPGDAFARIPFETWNPGNEALLRNFGLRLQLVIGPEVVFGLPQFSVAELRNFYEDYLRSLALRPEDFFSSGAGPRNHSGAQQRFDSALREIARKLAVAADANVADTQRLEAFVSLRSNSVFERTGVGFLLRLRPETRYRLELDLSANGQSLKYAQGPQELSEVYRQLLAIKRVLDSEGLDIRRAAESVRASVGAAN